MLPFVTSRLTLALAAAAIAAAAPEVRAAPFADLTLIDAAVARFAGAPVGQPGGAAAPVDRRLRLSACPAPLALSWRGPGGAAEGQTTVLVQCPGGWRLFVPVIADAAAPSAAPMVARGEGVTIVVRGDGFAVTQAGEALDPGVRGAWIRVRSGAKGEVLRGQVVRPGEVELQAE